MFSRVSLTLLLFSFLLISSCAPRATSTASKSRMVTQSGKASYYANKFQGRKTANGEIYSHNKLTAAHRTLPFGTQVKVTNLKNGKTVTVRINDRGPFVKGRVIDLSRSAARKIDMIRDGVVNVEIAYPRPR
ncbi:septal ring lytic transglycosylase RlpA family protein [Litoribacter ruber]|uniref:Probable endolytic peptidoglycan transglycosylase RlpA n=2 Tax=Litoribacter ruber TaxID=702568 RepID=A0AAP2CHW6_9BACT|nr:septal ring lytic transglycosylase RlpA family protein [Litoribacter alkaliphilus]MBT0811471.1 septal ring lytic transglycosylase RlpA family protein [Litoribacter ruber]